MRALFFCATAGVMTSALPIAAQGPGIEGFGPFRFGISPDELMQIAPVETRMSPDRPERGVWYELADKIDAFGEAHTATFMFDGADMLEGIMLDRVTELSDEACSLEFESRLAQVEDIFGPSDAPARRTVDFDIIKTTRTSLTQADGTQLRLAALHINDCRVTLSFWNASIDLYN